ncbi:MAG: UDP-2,3-diacylglucosamine diphosphatase LpxI [Planctomycetota bacterium]|nr:UDP-2,3-diacylglucosamine diphosphatase LpxI [Planctomycetota bacterium]
MSVAPPATGRIGLIAGWGRFPLLVADALRAQGREVVVVAIKGEADPALREHADAFHWTGLIQVGRMVELLKAEGCTTCVMAGKVHKTAMYARFRILRFRPDLTFFRLWFRALTDRRDDTLLGTFARFLQEHGITLLSSAELAPDLLAPSGVLTRRAPTAEERLDIAYGYRVARELGRRDIGQSAIVHERAVLALEAIEGTDAAIRRAGGLCPRGGFTLVKVAKPDQDMRFDVPAFGPLTVRTLADAGGAVIAYEARRTLLLDAEEAIALADARGVAIVGTTDDDVAALEADHRARVLDARRDLGAYGRAAEGGDEAEAGRS